MRALVEWAERAVRRAKAEAAAHPNGKGYWSHGSVKRRIEEAETRLRVEQLGASLEETPGALAAFLGGLRECQAKLTRELGYRPHGDEVVAALRPFAIAEIHSWQDEVARKHGTSGVVSASTETRRSNVLPFRGRRKQGGA